MGIRALLYHATYLLFEMKIRATSRVKKKGRKKEVGERRLIIRMPQGECDIEKSIRMAFRFAFGVSHNPPIPLLSRCFCARGRNLLYFSLPFAHPHPSGFARSLDIPHPLFSSEESWCATGVDEIQVLLG